MSSIGFDYQIGPESFNLALFLWNFLLYAFSYSDYMCILYLKQQLQLIWNNLKTQDSLLKNKVEK